MLQMDIRLEESTENLDTKVVRKSDNWKESVQLQAYIPAQNVVYGEPLDQQHKKSLKSSYKHMTVSLGGKGKIWSKAYNESDEKVHRGFCEKENIKCRIQQRNLGSNFSSAVCSVFLSTEPIKKHNALAVRNALQQL